MLTYAVVHVNVQHVIIVGHTNCGGAAACHAAAQATPAPAEDAPPPADPLGRWLAPLTELAREHEDLTALVEANVRAQVEHIAESDVMKGVWAQGKEVQVHGWVYELETGLLRDLGVSVGKTGAV